jgi:hypothetical protein
VLTSGDWITVREIVSRKPRRKRPMKRLPNALELDRGPALKPMVICGLLAMTEIDWTVVGSALLLVGWFGFLLLLLYFSPATMPP